MSKGGGRAKISKIMNGPAPLCTKTRIKLKKLFISTVENDKKMMSYHAIFEITSIKWQGSPCVYYLQMLKSWYYMFSKILQISCNSDYFASFHYLKKRPLIVNVKKNTLPSLLKSLCLFPWHKTKIFFENEKIGV